MMNQFSNNQIENIVDQKIAELKKANFDPKGIKAISILNGKITNHHITNYDDFKNFYKEQLVQNRANMMEIAKCADIVSKFSDMTPEFKNGNWLQEFADAKIKDPVLFASERNIKIEGKNALQWAYENNYKVQASYNYNPTKKIESQEQQWVKNSKNSWQQENVTVTKNKKEFKFYDPLEYIRSFKDASKLSSDELAFLYNADKYDLKDSDGHYIRDKIREMRLKTDDTIAKLHEAQDQNVIDKLTSLITTFSNQTLKGKITEQDVETFYDKAFEVLKKEKYINSSDIEIIKKGKDYKENIKETTNLVNSNIVELTIKEKLCYKLANLCKKLKLTNISNNLINKGISSKNLEKLHKADMAITASMKFGEKLIKHRSNEGIQIKRLENIQSKVKTSIEKTRSNRSLGSNPSR
ncbi:MAG: hypothetical protein RCO49_03885 [Rickettsia endosymbiont of Argas persicus]